ncbi:MAG: phosphatase PAP2 family protein [Planctomycetes bacterium]|nr:phosphatase PAP2 family protein [Planctomycetota bacterium]
MNQLDRRVSRPIHDLSLGPLDYLLVVPGMAFGSYVMPFTLGTIGLWLGWRVALVGAAASITTVAITSPLKHWFERERPVPLEAARKVRIRGLVKNPSFPSGDSAQAAVIALLLWSQSGVNDWRGFLWLGLIPACMFARVYFGAHWIGDTVGGAVIGAGVALLYLALFASFMA